MPLQPHRKLPSSMPPAGLVVTEVHIGEERFLAYSFPVEEGAMLEALSPAERVVARAVADGRSNREIALSRGTSVRTIAKQIASIFTKLGIGSRTELAARILGTGSVEGTR